MDVEEKNKLFALVGKDISYSFSKGYFTEKFQQLKLEKNKYVNFDIQSIDELPKLIAKHKAELGGLNVTIPYKEAVIPLLDKMSKAAKKIGAVNTIKVTKKGFLKGYNTDVYGFQKSIEPLLKPHHTKALILGTGGASKAIAFSLKKLGISFKFVSRNPQGKKQIGYNKLKKAVIQKHTVIINSTPLGTHPDVFNYPSIPYEFLTEKHLLFDLIYNPAETAFLTKGKERGATIKNGLRMLELQAEKSWQIWNGIKE
ncbi:MULTISPECIES: shikimate dehydrogenase family protein [Tenacibaculum]|uniref:shikimate dehydrogenase family protein n=1 Tax=Tenacibaculum TaxID=104267 RepID=UPI001F0AC4B7|nr:MULTISPECIES: shikimate dehydrogenase [Tenacibaculum]MCH3883167.1 shikimate dehydrogenase [Tenacibaculum aquimarinum]MDO6600905.1 shikimate dehydrogenase [Tenacibaculum sp. 1_MG-2023]